VLRAALRLSKGRTLRTGDFFIASEHIPLRFGGCKLAACS
jgi:hypothetical protein